MLDYLKRLFGFSTTTQVEGSQNKVEATQPKKCGCGRSESGTCVGLHALSEAEWATDSRNPNKAVPPMKKKTTVKKTTTTKKEPAVKTAVKAPARPRKTTKKIV
jgi:hypothetical protein